MISTVKREIAISKELHSKIKWACTFSNCELYIKNGRKTNIAYVKPRLFLRGYKWKTKKRKLQVFILG